MSSNQRGPTLVAPSYGVTWGGLPMYARRAMTVGLATLVAAGVAGPATAQAAEPSSAEQVSVIVRELANSGNAPERAVAGYGGEVTRALDIINGFTAEVPVDRLDALRAVPGVESVTEDGGLTLSDADAAAQAAQTGSLFTIANEVTGASDLWNAGYTGRGVDVAVIDSGVVPVDGLRSPGKVVHGPDLSFEALTCDNGPHSCEAGPLATLDTYGHGTHMAGIIAGRDSARSGLPVPRHPRRTG